MINLSVPIQTNPWISLIDTCRAFNSFKDRTVYEEESMGGNVFTEEQSQNIEKIRTILTDMKFPMGKIRFASTRCFQYSPLSDTINPEYKVLIPKYGANGKVNIDQPTIEIGKPSDLITIRTMPLRMLADYAYSELKKVMKKYKRGVVVYPSSDWNESDCITLHIAYLINK